MTAKQATDGRYIMLVSVHGLIRGDELELGRDADTGGQTKYVVELARALAEHPRVGQVDLVTRRVLDRRVSGDYARVEEPLAEKARILRVTCGPDRYIPKEGLWPHLDAMVDQLLDVLRRSGRVPDLVHGHYADAGYVAARLAGLLGVPIAFTGHSLGRVKRERLLEGGAEESALERRYQITRRIDAEEFSLDSAHLVVASTKQEVEDQYGLYDQYDPRRMHVIPPGVDLGRFSPPRKGAFPSPIEREINRFLAVPEKPPVLAVSRPDPRKNIPRLVEAFATHPHLRDAANLVLVAGNRDNIRDLDRGARETWLELLDLIDRHDLYGSVAYPKHHGADDVPDLYRMAAAKRGIFVNPALTEPFGLTLLEAAASGVPVVATNDGGPREILNRCQNGVLVDPLDVPALGNALADGLSDPARWRRWQRQGLRGVARHFSWRAHVDNYLKVVDQACGTTKKARRPDKPRGRLLTADRLLIADIDNTLVGKKEPLKELQRRILQAGSKLAFGVATGRRLDLAVAALEEHKVPPPDFLITSVGTAIHFGARRIEDRAWQQHIDHRWNPKRLREVASQFSALEPQPSEGQDTYKVSFIVDGNQPFDTAELQTALRRADSKPGSSFPTGPTSTWSPCERAKGSPSGTWPCDSAYRSTWSWSRATPETTRRCSEATR